MQNLSMLNTSLPQPMAVHQVSHLSQVPTMVHFPQSNTIVQAPLKHHQLLTTQQLGQHHLQPTSAMQPFLLTSQFSINSQTPIIKSPESNANPTMIPISLAEMASIISPMTKRRAESFVIEEIKLMLQEIDRRKHILLSVSPATNRLKRRAWEEVANCMALRWPQEIPRSGDQIKKKWENLASKTKRKVRDGQMTTDIEWNETNTLVMQFLASASNAMRIKQANPVSSNVYNQSTTSTLSDGNSVPCSNYLQNYPPFSSLAVFPSPSSTSVEKSFGNLTTPNLSTARACSTNSIGCKVEDSMPDTHRTETANQIALDESPRREAMSMEEPEQCSRNTETSAHQNSSTHVSVPPWANLGMSVDESVLTSLAPIGHPLLNIAPNLVPVSMQEELMQQARREHRLRMQILKMQRQAWKLNTHILTHKCNRLAQKINNVSAIEELRHPNGVVSKGTQPQQWQKTDLCNEEHEEDDDDVDGEEDDEEEDDDEEEIN